MINLCELLLDELKIYGDFEAFEEAKSLVRQLTKYAKKQKSFRLFVNILILQSKFAMIDGKLYQSLKYLDQAKDTTRKMNLSLLNRKLIEEKTKLEEEYSKWQGLIMPNAAINERVEEAELEDYLKELKEIIQLED